MFYNTVRPHGSLGYKPPSPEVFVPAFAARGRLRNFNQLRRPRWRPGADRKPRTASSRKRSNSIKFSSAVRIV